LLKNCRVKSICAKLFYSVKLICGVKSFCNKLIYFVVKLLEITRFFLNYFFQFGTPYFMALVWIYRVSMSFLSTKLFSLEMKKGPLERSKCKPTP